MRIRSVAAVTAGVLLTGVAATVVAVPAGADGGVPLGAELTGAAEAPGPGDPDGTGSAELAVNVGLRKVCFSYTTANLMPIVGAHVHRAPAGTAGPVVIPLSTSGSGCATADRDLLREIVRDPSAFYVNVHTTDFGAGAVRGQLHR